MFCFCRALSELWQGPCLGNQIQQTVVESVPAAPINLLAAQVPEPLVTFISLPKYEGCATATKSSRGALGRPQVQYFIALFSLKVEPKLK